MKKMLIHRFSGNHETKVYRHFNLYGETWCVCHSAARVFFHDKQKMNKNFILSNYKTGMSVGRMDYRTSIEALREGRKILLRNGKSKILKLLKRLKVIN